MCKWKIDQECLSWPPSLAWFWIGVTCRCWTEWRNQIEVEVCRQNIRLFIMYTTSSPWWSLTSTYKVALVNIQQNHFESKLSFFSCLKMCVYYKSRLWPPCQPIKCRKQARITMFAAVSSRLDCWVKKWKAGIEIWVRTRRLRSASLCEITVSQLFFFSSAATTPPVPRRYRLFIHLCITQNVWTWVWSLRRYVFFSGMNRDNMTN